MTEVKHKRALFVAAIRTTKKSRSKTWNKVYDVTTAAAIMLMLLTIAVDMIVAVLGVVAVAFIAVVGAAGAIAVAAVVMLLSLH